MDANVMLITWAEVKFGKT